jgi:hypothetical protein
MAAVGVAGGLPAFAVLGCTPFGTGSLEQTMCHLAVLTLGCGIAALLGETSWALLVLMMAGIVIMWALARTRRRIPHAKPRRQAHLNISLKARLPPPPGRPPARRVTAWQLSPGAMAAVAGAVIAAGPQPGAGGGVVGDHGVRPVLDPVRWPEFLGIRRTSGLVAGTLVPVRAGIGPVH